jgi:peptide deformylase
MIRTVITYPDKQLKQVSKPVEKFDQELHTILDDMYETMMVQNGIGLAAIQVALPIRVLLLNIPDEEGEQHKEDLIEMINPSILSTQGETTYQEGCLSVPGFYEDINRFEKVTVNYFDRHGKEQTLDAEDLLSVAVQHEIDHLDGKLFIEKLSYAKRKKFEKELKKKLRENKKAS